MQACMASAGVALGPGCGQRTGITVVSPYDSRQQEPDMPATSHGWDISGRLRQQMQDMSCAGVQLMPAAWLAAWHNEAT